MALLLIGILVLFILIVFFPQLIAMLMALGVVTLICYSICQVTGNKYIAMMVLTLGLLTGISQFVEIVSPGVEKAKKHLDFTEEKMQEYKEDIDRVEKTIEKVQEFEERLKKAPVVIEPYWKTPYVGPFAKPPKSIHKPIRNKESKR